jgi:uncharacterized protein YajQ (UPF0234 family)
MPDFLPAPCICKSIFPSPEVRVTGTNRGESKNVIAAVRGKKFPVATG